MSKRIQLNSETIANVLKLADRSILHGPAGVGKTHFANFINPDNTYNLTLTRSTSVADLLGFWQIKNNSFEFHEGPVTRAIKNDGVLVLNEIDESVGSEIETFLMNILDDKTICRIYLPTGELLTIGPNFKVIATMNSHPSNLRPELRDRFDVEIPVRQINDVQETMLDADCAKYIKNVLNERARTIEHSAPTYTYRRLKSFCYFRTQLDVRLAAMVCTGDEKLESVDCFLQSLVSASIDTGK